MIVEDGTGKTNANAYCTAAFAADYHAARGNAAWDAVEDADAAIVRLGQDAIALAESKDVELRAALADVQRLTGERDGYQARVVALDAEANALRAEIEALKAPKAVLRVPTAALLIVIERRGLTAQLDAIRAALPEQQQREFDLYLRFPETRRDHPLVAMVQQAFGWTDAQADDVFAEADAV